MNYKKVNLSLFKPNQFWGWWFDQEWLVLPIAGDLAAEAEVFAILRKCIIEAGDNSLLIAPFVSQKLEFQSVPIPLSDIEMFDFIKDSSVSDYDYVITGSSCSWGSICYVDYYSMIGGTKIFIRSLLNQLASISYNYEKVHTNLIKAGINENQCKIIMSCWLKPAKLIAEYQK